QFRVMRGIVLLLSLFSGECPCVCAFFLSVCLYVLSSCLSRNFYFINMGKTWTDAQTYCRNNYFDLATIRDKDDLQNLVNSAPSGFFGPAWIGLFDDVNSWHWSLSDSSFYSTGETSFRNWESGEPDNLGGQEYCAAMTPGGTWDSYSWGERGHRKLVSCGGVP
uniref:C-type lectin domain-containing protein n=1 Tax=Scleropages formosus TaxID=113540 RepID=A0A8C9S3D1_SCLFO